MNLLLAEINRKRKINEEVRQNSTDGSKSKYLRQRDIIAHQAQQKEEEQRQLDEKRAERDIQVTTTTNHISEISSVENREEDKNEISNMEQVIQKDDEDTKELEKNITSNSNNDNSKKYDSDSDNEDGQKAVDVRIKYSLDVHYTTLPDLPKEKAIHKYLKCLLKHWEFDLSLRPEQEKLSTKGKMDTQLWKQCKDHMKPLFKMCKKKMMSSPEMTDHLFEIVRLCELGEFRLAHEEYLRTAIGNAAWPIGLTMVGIHERSGRERISTAKIAHVMNNEQERKYLTSIRRLMTFAQSKRPDVPPSMKVL